MTSTKASAIALCCLGAACLCAGVAQAAPASGPASGPGASLLGWSPPVLFQWGEEGGGGGWGEEGGGGDEWGGEGGEGGGDEWGAAEAPAEEGPSETPGGEKEGYLAGKMRTISLGLFFNYSLILSGDAGSATNAPAYDEAFSGGAGGGLLFGYRLMPALDLAVGLGLTAFTAKTFEREDPSAPGTMLEHSFSTYMPISLSLGVKLHFLLDRGVGDWFSFDKDKAQTGFTPYVGYLLGVGFYPTVEWSEPDTTKYPACDYWDSGIVLLQNFMVGAEFRFSPSMGVFVEVGLGTVGAPSASGNDTANGVNEAGSMMNLNLRLGLALAF